MDYNKIKKLTKEIDWAKLDFLVRESLKVDGTGHDYEHTQRVLKVALKIAEKCENIDYDVLVAAVLLHDIAFKDGHVKEHHVVWAEQAPQFLKQINFPTNKIKKVQITIEDHVGQTQKPVRAEGELQIESKILRDADNIDALGAIGLVRQIAFCASKNRHYFISKDDAFNESVYGGVKEIMTWANKMLLPEAKKIANERIEIMKDFLEQLEKEYA